MKWRRSPAAALGIEAAFARNTRMVVARCTIPAGSKSTALPLRWGEAGAATPAIEMTARDEERASSQTTRLTIAMRENRQWGAHAV